MIFQNNNNMINIEWLIQDNIQIVNYINITHSLKIILDYYKINNH